MSAQRELRVAALDAQEPERHGPTPERIDRTRDEIAVRAGDLELTHPDALDLAAELYVEVHAQLCGRATELRGPRRPKYFREQLRGVHPLTVEDLARLALAVPEAMVPFVRRLARELGCTLTPSRRAVVTLHEASARVAETAGRTTAAVQRATADGNVDGAEAVDIERRIEELQAHLDALKAAARERK